MTFQTWRRELLLSNVKDEENHDLALGITSPMLMALIRKGRERKRVALRELLGLRTQITLHPQSHGGRACNFLCTTSRSYALMVDAGMRTVSADISRDEQIHVAV